MKTPSRRLSREEQRARKVLIKEFATAFKAVARASKWQYLYPSPFRAIGDWFVEVWPSIHQDEERASISIRIKPLRIDSLMSEMKTGSPLGKHPLSLLARGVYCFGETVYDQPMDSTSGCAVLLKNAELCLLKAEQIATGYTLDEYYEQVMLGRRLHGIRVEGIATLLMQNETNLVRKLLAQSRACGSGGLSSSHGITAANIESWMEKNPFGPRKSC